MADFAAVTAIVILGLAWGVAYLCPQYSGATAVIAAVCVTGLVMGVTALDRRKNKRNKDSS